MGKRFQASYHFPDRPGRFTRLLGESPAAGIHAEVKTALILLNAAHGIHLDIVANLSERPVGK